MHTVPLNCAHSWCEVGKQLAHYTQFGMDSLTNSNLWYAYTADRTFFKFVSNDPHRVNCIVFCLTTFKASNQSFLQ